MRVLTKLPVIFVISLLTCQAAIAQNDTPFKPSGKVFGESFGDYAYKISADSLTSKRGNTQYVNKNKGYNAFDIRRVYLGYLFHFTKRFTAEVMVANDGINALPDLNRAVYLKYANLRYKDILPGIDVIIGQQRSPAFSTPNGEEYFWKYRSIEKTFTDLRGFAPATDLGINFQGLNKSKTTGFDLMIGNNSAAKIIPATSKRVYFDVYHKFFNKRLEIQLYSDAYTQKFTLYNSDYRRVLNVNKLFAAWKTKGFTIGAEAVYQLKTRTHVHFIDSVTYSFASSSPFGFSVFAHGIFLKDTAGRELLNGFIRFDNLDPDMMITAEKAVQTDDPKEYFFTAGLDYEPSEGIHFMPNIWVDAYRTKLNANVMNKSDMDVVARLTFSYKF